MYAVISVEISTCRSTEHLGGCWIPEDSGRTGEACQAESGNWAPKDDELPGHKGEQRLPGGGKTL